MQAARGLDSHWPLREALRHIAEEKSEWAGIPMPLGDQKLVIEPSWPFADALTPPEPHGPPDPWFARNQWFSRQHGCDIILMQRAGGRVTWGKLPAMNHASQQLQTLGACDAWGLEQEARAMQLAADLLTHRQMRQYVLTGSFLERSRRSGVTYMFRRLRPTIAMEARPGMPEREDDGMRMLAALCAHPIAHYAGSWAGAMCPTDDVIAHLMLMRGDEHMFWKRSNQHPSGEPQAGL